MATLHINGMKCQHCQKAAQKTLEELGATQVVVDLEKGEASYEGSPDKEALRKALADKGFELAD
ncbi:heavy-metal-associated domain-containing protein [Desulfobulbus rhabdoformis]|uniref:heavy-metal-associated domain-containing protein n=1 Tax=Desulfobulbus rhabdoformis TaxID=34032 RepID=UPI0019642F01|nr:heavy metal-associated domain-containing protein [Desulfobulbus rhabdoformis]MBM9615341.1 heavy-metal-associated domain-containing protein [Desulfobulbus rhabdoformis]